MEQGITLPQGIRIIASDLSTGVDVIPALMRIEEEVYAPEDRGEYTSIRARVERYPEMFILACDADEVIGYLCWFPITERLYSSIMHGTDFYDDNIRPEDVCSLSESTHVYLISIALRKSYQNTGVADGMMEMLLERLHKEASQGRKVTELLGSVISEDGRRFVERYGFHQIAVAPDGRFKLYRRDGELT